VYLDEATHKFISTLLNFLPTSAYYHHISSQRVHPSLTSQGSTVNRIRTTNLRKEAGPPTSTLGSTRALGSPGVLLAKVTRQPTTKDGRRRTNYCCDLEEVILFPLYTVTLAFFGLLSSCLAPSSKTDTSRAHFDTFFPFLACCSHTTKQQPFFKGLLIAGALRKGSKALSCKKGNCMCVWRERGSDCWGFSWQNLWLVKSVELIVTKCLAWDIAARVLERTRRSGSSRRTQGRTQGRVPKKARPKASKKMNIFMGVIWLARSHPVRNTPLRTAFVRPLLSQLGPPRNCKFLQFCGPWEGDISIKRFWGCYRLAKKSQRNNISKIVITVIVITNISLSTVVSHPLLKIFTLLSLFKKKVRSWGYLFWDNLCPTP